MGPKLHLLEGEPSSTSFVGWSWLCSDEILRPKSHVWCSHTTARASLGTSIAGVVPRGPGATAGVLRCPPGCTVVAHATKNTPNRLVIAVFPGFLKRAAQGGTRGSGAPAPARPSAHSARSRLPAAVRWRSRALTAYNHKKCEPCHVEI